MKKALIICVITVASMIGIHPAFAQDSNGAMMQALIRTLERDGWSKIELDEMVGYLAEYNLGEMRRADPEIIALALKYSRERDAESFQVQSAALMAAQLARTSREMSRLGYRNRHIAQAALEGMRFMLNQKEEIGRMEIENTLQKRVNRHVRTSEGTGIRERIQHKLTGAATAPSAQMQFGPPAHVLPPGVGTPNPEAPGNPHDGPGQDQGQGPGSSQGSQGDNPGPPNNWKP